MRKNKRNLTALALVAGAAVCAAPAVAAQDQPSPASVQQVSGGLGLGWLAQWSQATAQRERRLARRSGPFVPVVGKVDYGTAENGFGAARTGHVHAGQDLFAPSGTPVVAPVDSKVLETGSDGGQGNYVHLRDRKRDRTYVYMHLVEPASVKVGEAVRAGEQLGGVGCTGSCWGEHLHFEIREGSGYEGEAIDPMPYLRDWRNLAKPLG